MPQLVRAGLNHNRWADTEGREAFDLPADVLLDLKTTGNQLSVFEVSEAITPERIAIALVANNKQGKPDHTGYAVLDRAAVEALGITLRKTTSDTPDAEVNPLHWDLDVGTSGKLVAFASLIANAPPKAILKKDVERLLKEGFESGRLDYTKNIQMADRVKANVPRHTDPGEGGVIEIGPVDIG